jgi:hypothetical protein
VSTFVDRGVSRGQRGGSPTVVNLSFLDRVDCTSKIKSSAFTSIWKRISPTYLIAVTSYDKFIKHLGVTL